MLEALITSKTRIKLLLKFFLNPISEGYLRGLSTEFGESTNAIRLELNRLEEAGLLTSDSSGHKKMFHANQQHPLFNDIQNIIRKYVGMDKIIEKVVNHLGEPQDVYLIGDLAKGHDSKELHILIIGENINQEYLDQLCHKAQKLISRKISAQLMTTQDFQEQKPELLKKPLLKVWTRSNENTYLRSYVFT